MPLGIGMLTLLRTLSRFIVDKSKKGRKIFELKSLHHLQGTISIIGLENVMNVQDAMEANLSGKEGLHGLEMKWSSDFSDGTREGGIEFDVLDALKAQIGLRSLEIEFYGGHRFPSWIGDQSFCDMVKVRLNGCENCTQLPPLGQLSSLKELFIEGMSGVKVVGLEFFGTKFTPPIVTFRSLINLNFEDMKGWEEWSANSRNGDEDFKGAFPCLQKLHMSGCMKLNKVSLSAIPSLVSLELHGCGQTVLRSIARVCSVNKLELEEISGLAKLDEGIIRCLGEVENLRVSGCKQLRYLWEENVAYQALEKLKFLVLEGCEQLESLGDEEQLLPQNLEILELNSCDKLHRMPNWQNNHMSLKQLTIKYCQKLQDYLISATNLDCKTEFANLESVSVEGCPSLEWFPTGKKLPTTLRKLHVRDCENMNEPEGENGISLPLLELVIIFNWSHLKSFPRWLTNLTELYIGDCAGIESIPETSLPSTLIVLHISSCSNLKYMLCANEMQSLTSLRELSITSCKNLQNYPSGGRWPPNLNSLVMEDINKPITEWGLAKLPVFVHKLTFLGSFPQLVSFSEVGTQLPTRQILKQLLFGKLLQ